MNLLIVESPSKAKTINKYLGKEYKVVSSVGHIIDLPKSNLGVNVDKDFSIDYTVIPGKEKVIREIIKNAKEASNIILATDPDREGEAIAWHLKNKLKTSKNVNANIKRIVFHEITQGAIKEAIKHKGDINQDLVDAQQARRVLDRLVGYTLSPLIWKKIRYGLSAGRVQSVALRLIVLRERERRAFVPAEYWSLDLTSTNQTHSAEPSVHIFLKQNDVGTTEEKDDDQAQKAKPDYEKLLEQGVLTLSLNKISGKKAIIKDQQEFHTLTNDINKKKLLIDKINKKTSSKSPVPPFTTSTFQQACINSLGLSSKNAMRIAQKLYENGLITYMRTDSLYLSNEAINGVRKTIKSEFGTKYLPEKPNYYKNKSKNSQEAHEAIRPTDFKVKSLKSSFSDKDKKVYELIYKRAMASQMNKAQFENISVEAKVDKYLFRASTQKLIFDGWMALYSVKQNKRLIKLLESLEEGKNLSVIDIFGYQHFTEPPPRYSEASLIKQLEKDGIGRPSTYASIMGVISERNYVEKDGKYFFPTETGEVVIRLLEENFPKIVDVDFTAGMEGKLDAIANNEQDWIPMLEDFWAPFKTLVDQKDKELKKEDFVILGETEIDCDLCGKKMIKKIGRFGVFLSCSDFPNCKGMKGLNENPNEPQEVNEEFLKTYQPAPTTEDGRDYALKTGRFGQFWAHPDYPKVKDAKPLEFREEKIIELYGKPPDSKDGKQMILRKGRFGFFWAHPDYPKVKEIQKVKKQKT